MLLLLVIPFGLLWLLIAGHRTRLGFGNLSIRGALVLAYLAFEVLLLGITELSSAGHHFTAGTVAILWLIVIIILLFAARTQITGLVRRARSHDGSRFGLTDRVRRLSGEDRFWIAILIAIFGLLVATGFFYRPSYGDSLVYHLARVEHWIQNRTVAPFATHNLEQVEFAPLSEYNLAHLHLLSGTDRFDACMELLAALVSIVGVSELARLLGASRSTQIAASVICATIPSGILLATSTDNDYLAAATGIGVLIILTAFSFQGRWGYRAVALGAAIGLAYMAKSTMSALLGPAVVALFAVAVYRQVRSGRGRTTLENGIAQVAVIAASTVAIVSVFLVQTDQVFGTLLGPTTKDLISSPITIRGLGANVTAPRRPTSISVTASPAFKPTSARWRWASLRHTYSVFGVSINNPHFAGILHSQTFAVSDYTLDQRIAAYGANPWNVLLAVAAIVVLIVAVARGRREFRLSLVLALSLGCGFLLLTGIGKWEPYDVRFQLPSVRGRFRRDRGRLEHVPPMGHSSCAGRACHLVSSAIAR